MGRSERQVVGDDRRVDEWTDEEDGKTSLVRPLLACFSLLSLDVLLLWSSDDDERIEHERSDDGRQVWSPGPGRLGDNGGQPGRMK